MSEVNENDESPSSATGSTAPDEAPQSGTGAKPPSAVADETFEAAKSSTAKSSADDDKPDADEKPKSSADTKSSVDGKSAVDAKSTADAKSTTGEAQVKSVEQKKSEVKQKSGIDTKKKSETGSRKDSRSKSKQKSRTSTASKSSSEIDQKGSRTGQSKSKLKLEDMSKAKVGFVGAGRMTDCIVRGLIKSEKVNAKQIYICAKTNKNLEQFKMNGYTTSTRSYDIFARYDCDIIFLCMHGYVVKNCFKMGGTRPAPFTTNYIPTKHKTRYILSLAGGVTVDEIKTTLLNPETLKKYKIDIHRVMINASAAYGLGLGALDVEIDSPNCQKVIRDMLQSLCTRFERMDQGLIDAACAVGGNGLAFVYYFMSALADGGFKMGLSKAKSTRMAAKVMQSAAMVMLESNKTPSELRDMCTSPSSPILYGLTILESKDAASGIQSAVEGAFRRIKELADHDAYAK